MQADGNTASAAELVIAAVPSDDAGARTADRYEWQAAMAAADGLSLYHEALSTGDDLAKADRPRVLCEHHEDWVILRGNDAELVSAKHVGLSFGAFTSLNSLADVGGVAHLFDRWLLMHQKVACRLVTTAGVAGPSQKLLRLIEILHDRRLAGRPLMHDESDSNLVTQFAATLLRYSGRLPRQQISTPYTPQQSIPTTEQVDQVARFLSTFSIQSRIPRQHVAAAAPAMFAQPVLDRLQSTAAANQVWDAVVGLFRLRMRGAGPVASGGLPWGVGYRSGSATSIPGAVANNLARRIVTLLDIHTSIHEVAAASRRGSSLAQSAEGEPDDDPAHMWPSMIDQFADVDFRQSVSKSDLNALRRIPEAVVKNAFAEVFGEADVPKDWGGEQFDLWIHNRLTIEGLPLRTAIAFKGPAKFHPMTIADLGKNGDQIDRLAQTAADLIIVQHCHSITASVVNMLKAYAHNPRNPKRYMTIDGYDTIRILRSAGFNL